MAAYTAKEALTIASQTRPDLTIMDVYFHGVSAIDAAIHISETEGPVLLMSGASESTKVLRQLTEHGHEQFWILPKPTHPRELLKAVRQILSSDSTLHQRRAA